MGEKAVISRRARGLISPICFVAVFIAQQTALGQVPERNAVCEKPDQGIGVLEASPPPYPSGAVAYCVEGYVVVEGDVQPDGSVSNVHIVDSQPSYVFDEAARAIEQWRFVPACEEGEPVSSRFNQRIDFQFEGDGGDGPCVNDLRDAPREAQEMYAHVLSLISGYRLDMMERVGGYGPLEPLPVEPRFSGDWGIIERYFLDYANRSISLSNYVAARMREIGWDRIRSPDRLAVDEGLAESRRILADMHELYHRANEMARDAVRDMREETALLDVGEEARALFLGDGHAIDDEILAGWEFVPRSHWDMLAENEAIIDLLEQAGGRWTVEGGRIHFPKQQEADQFRAHSHAIEDLEAQERFLELELLDHAWRMIEGTY